MPPCDGLGLFVLGDRARLPLQRTKQAQARGDRLGDLEGRGADGAIVINLSPDSNDKFMGPDIAGANNKDLINTKLTANHWDYVIVGPDVAGNGLEVKKIRGTWATEG